MNDNEQVVRQLEQLFPGESEFLRNDLIFLLVLNGNDYLPKVSVHTPVLTLRCVMCVFNVCKQVLVVVLVLRDTECVGGRQLTLHDSI
jgi:hypothetical protein